MSYGEIFPRVRACLHSYITVSLASLYFSSSRFLYFPPSVTASDDYGASKADETPKKGSLDGDMDNDGGKMLPCPKTNIKRFGLDTALTFLIALCMWYDDSTLYALRYVKHGLSNPRDGQRNGRRPGPSRGGQVDCAALATWAVSHFSIHNFWNHARQEAKLGLSFVRLTDEGVFYCICTISPHDRGVRFQADFDQHSDVRATRVPLGPPVIIWAHGKPWFPVYKAFYVLCGSWNAASYLPKPGHPPAVGLAR